MKLLETKTNFLAGKVTAYLAIEFGLHKIYHAALVNFKKHKLYAHLFSK